VPRALRLAKSVDPLALHLLLVEQIAQCADEFDVIHFHIAPLHFSIARRLSIPHVTTLHGRLDLPEVVTLYGEFSDLPLVSVSDAQRGPIPDQNWVGTVYHGLPNRELQFSAGAGGYLAFLGVYRQRNVSIRAIDIAKACGCPLKIAAKVDPADQRYFEQHIEPLLDHPLIDYCGEITEGTEGCVSRRCEGVAVSDRLARALWSGHDRGARLWYAGWLRFAADRFPKFSNTASPGSSVTTCDEAIDATKRIHTLDRRACRRTFERRFTATRMTEDYVQLYRRIAADAALYAD
jgi:glycosyltransferase involved in cell wall biosynthesis